MTQRSLNKAQTEGTADTGLTSNNAAQYSPQRTSAAPIGVFDSGAGGLTILQALRDLLPQENYIYFGDTAHCPYGTKSEAEITALTLHACRFLMEQGVKLIVVACNTASQAALATLRATLDLPFVGVVPAVKPAAQATHKGRIGIAATNQAAQASYLQGLIHEFAQGIQVYTAGYPELVTLVERGELNGPQVEETLKHVFHPMLSHDIDVLVLGCTHFPALRPAIERVVGKEVQVIDSSAAVARRTRSVLEAAGLANEAGAINGAPTEAAGLERALLQTPSNHTATGKLHVWCSGDALTFSKVASTVLGYAVTAQQAMP